MEIVGLVAGVALPLWNIPLLIRIQKRKSSKDISPVWALGVWGCLLAMLPSGLASPDIAYKAFTISNVVFFAAVVVQVFRFR